MGVVNRLNALDERAGVRGPIGARRWQARLRLWWLGIGVAYGLAFASVLFALLNEGSASAAVAIALLPGAFYSGFLYNERLRELGRRPRLLEVPAKWPDPPRLETNAPGHGEPAEGRARTLDVPA